MNALNFDNLQEFEGFLKLCRAYDVTTVKDGESIIQFQPKMPDFAEPQIDERTVPGGWKRPADLGE